MACLSCYSKGCNHLRQHCSMVVAFVKTREKCDWVTVVELLKFYDDGNAGSERHHRLQSSEMRNLFVPCREDHYFPPWQ
jgi:hypothetical protein